MVGATSGRPLLKGRGDGIIVRVLIFYWTSKSIMGQTFCPLVPPGGAGDGGKGTFFNCQLPGHGVKWGEVGINVDGEDIII